MKNLQKGRSMIEMLGVLAIVGVLSIGGLAGYTMAMNRYRASNISDYVSRCVVVAQTKSLSGRISKTAGANVDCETVLGEEVPGWLTGTSKSVTIAETEDTGEIRTTITSLPSAVDQVLQERFNTASSDSDAIGGVKYLGNGVFVFLGSATSSIGSGTGGSESGTTG